MLSSRGLRGGRRTKRPAGCGILRACAHSSWRRRTRNRGCGYGPEAARAATSKDAPRRGWCPSIVSRSGASSSLGARSNSGVQLNGNAVAAVAPCWRISPGDRLRHVSTVHENAEAALRERYWIRQEHGAGRDSLPTQGHHGRSAGRPGPRPHGASLSPLDRRPLPALDERTPRAAAKDVAMRPRPIALIHGLEPCM